MTEVVFQMISLGLERVVVFIFNLPASTPSNNNTTNILFAYFEIGDKRIMIDLFALRGNGDLSPIHLRPTVHGWHNDRCDIPICFLSVFYGMNT